MSFFTGNNYCDKCGKPLGVFEQGLCVECEKAEQEPCDDVVSRQAVLDIVGDMYGLARPDVLSATINQIKSLTSAIPKEPCDDAISREMALKECYDIVIDGECYRVIQEETLLGLPPVRPQEPQESDEIGERNLRMWEELFGRKQG